MTSSLSSLTTGNAIPTPTACIGDVTLNDIDRAGFSGQVCQVNVRPDDVNITSCCNQGSEVRLKDNCTQFCEADDRNDFSNCINGMIPASRPFLESLCVKLSGDASASGSETGARETSTPTSTDESGNGAQETGTDGDEGM